MMERYETRREEALAGAAIAGALLLAMPLLDVLVGANSPGPVHLVVCGLGAMLIALSGRRP